MTALVDQRNGIRLSSRLPFEEFVYAMAGRIRGIRLIPRFQDLMRFFRRKMHDNVVSVKIDVDTLLARTTCLAPEDVDIESASSLNGVNRDGQVKLR